MDETMITLAPGSGPDSGPESVPLSTLMREGSQAEHTAAESSTFMAELLAGRVSEAGYAAYLSRLARIYTALETVGRSLARAGDPVAGAVLDPALERLEALGADLAFWGHHAAPPATAGAESPATLAYVDRIEGSAAWGGLYVAHHYTRYLGDLSGGQAVGRILARTFDLSAAEGIAFYQFAAIPKPKPYKDAYRARLDALVLDGEEKQRIVDEVSVVFGLNSAIFAELGGNLDAYRR